MVGLEGIKLNSDMTRCRKYQTDRQALKKLRHLKIITFPTKSVTNDNLLASDLCPSMLSLAQSNNQPLYCLSIKSYVQSTKQGFHILKNSQSSPQWAKAPCVKFTS